MPEEPVEKVPVGFWRHMPWIYVVGFVVSAVLVGFISSYYDTYGGAALILWGSVIVAGFQESRKLERKRIADGDPHPTRRPTPNTAEVALAAAFVLISGALIVFASYITIDGDHHVPTPTEAVLAGIAALISALTIGAVVLWVRRKNRLEVEAAA